MINIALPKGRLGDSVYELFEHAGFSAEGMKDDTRKLIFTNEEKGISFFWVKPSDVAVYVSRGAADIGVCGKDILLEYRPDIYELLDLKEGACRMMVAAPEGFHDDTERTLKVATKFPGIASKYFAARGRDIDIIELHGSIELAPILKLSDVIVDIVETGRTLKANGLVPMEKIVDISARLIANKASFKFNTDMIQRIMEGLAEAIADR